MITRDEKKLLKSCITPIKKSVDEIIIVDTGSKDRTIDIARSFTDNVYDFRWKDDFSAARNFSISKASMPWILALDPDEVISKEDIARLKLLIKERKENILGYRLVQRTYHKGKIIFTRGICRAFRNDGKMRFIYPVHETIRESIKKAKGRIGKTGIVIRHHPVLDKRKSDYYMSLLKIKKERFPSSSAQKEIENELRIKRILSQK